MAANAAPYVEIDFRYGPKVRSDLRAVKRPRVAEDYTWDPTYGIRFASDVAARDKDYTWNLLKGIRFSFGKTENTIHTRRVVSRRTGLPSSGTSALPVVSHGGPTAHAEHPRYASTKSKPSTTPAPQAYRPSSITGRASAPLNAARRNSKRPTDVQGMLKMLGHPPAPLPVSKKTPERTQEEANNTMLEGKTSMKTTEIARGAHNKPRSASSQKLQDKNIQKAMKVPSKNFVTEDTMGPIVQVARLAQDQPVTNSGQSASTKKTRKSVKEPSYLDIVAHDAEKTAAARPVVTKRPVKPMSHEVRPESTISPQMQLYVERQNAAKSREHIRERRLKQEREAQLQEERERRELEVSEALSQQEADYERWELGQLAQQRAYARSTYVGLQKIFSPVRKSWTDMIRAMKDMYKYYDNELIKPEYQEPATDSSQNIDDAPNYRPIFPSNSSSVLPQTSQRQCDHPMSRRRRERVYWICRVDNMLEGQGEFVYASHDYRSSLRDRQYLTESPSGDLEMRGMPAYIRPSTELMLPAQLVLIAAKAMGSHGQELMRAFRSAASWRPQDAFGPNADQMEAELVPEAMIIMGKRDLKTSVEPGEGDGLRFSKAKTLMFTNPLRLTLLGGERFVEVWHEAEAVFRERQWLQSHILRTCSVINRIGLGLFEAPSMSHRENRLQIYRVWHKGLELVTTSKNLIGCTQSAFEYSAPEPNSKLSGSPALSHMLADNQTVKKSWWELSLLIRWTTNDLSQLMESRPATPSPLTSEFRATLHRLWKNKTKEDNRREESLLNQLSLERNHFADFWIPELRKLPQTPQVERIISEMRSEKKMHSSRSRRGRAAGRISMRQGGPRSGKRSTHHIETSNTKATKATEVATSSRHRRHPSPRFASSTKRVVLSTPSLSRANKSGYHSSATLQDLESLPSCDVAEPQVSGWPYDDELDQEETMSSPTGSDDGESSAGASIDREALGAMNDRELAPLTYQIPGDDIKKDLASYESGKECYWSHLKYRGPNGRSPSVRYCTTLQQSEEVAQIFAQERVIGFDMEWKIGGSSIKEQISVIQIACDATIAVFHLSLYKGDTVDELIGPNLREILESPDILKSGVNIGQDFKRVRKYLGFLFKGCFELSYLHNLVMLSPNGGRPGRRLASLAKQVEHHLMLPLRKDDVRTSDWSKRLNYEQVCYAAADAYAGFRLFHELEAKRYKLTPVPPRPDTIEIALITPDTNDPKSLPDTAPANATCAEEGDAFSEHSESFLSTTDSIQLNTDENEPAANIPTDSANSKRSAKRRSSTTDEESTETPATVVGKGHTRTARPGNLSGLIAYPDLTACLQSLGIEEATTVVTQHSEAQAASTLHLSLADTWIDDWMQGLPEGVTPKSRRRQLQAYTLWHEQGMSVRHIAAVLKNPPLSPNTVISYILDVVRDEELAFDTARLRDLLPSLHQNWVQRRYWSLLKRME